MAHPCLYDTKEEELGAAVRSYERVLTAWRDVSSKGACRAIDVANALLTFRDVSLTGMEPALGVLGTLLNDADDALIWLVDAIDKLRRMLLGLEATVAQFSARVDDKVAEPILATATYSTWTSLFADAARHLRSDLEDKTHVVVLFKSIIDGTLVPDPAKLEMAAETWLEMPRVRALTLNRIPAAFQAELAASDELKAVESGVAEAQTCLNSLQISDATIRPASRSPKPSPLSPALQFLLDTSTPSKRKKGPNKP